MDKIYVVYWSQTGNTKQMAEAIGEGIVSKGKEAAVLEVGDASVDELKNAEVFALGCPAMGAEVLEETEMEPFVTELENYVKDKKIALFGSYGWGDGEWMRDWVKRMTDAGAIMIAEEGLMCNEAPDDDGIEKCKELGEKLADN